MGMWKLAGGIAIGLIGAFVGIVSLCGAAKAAADVSKKKEA